MLHSEPTWPPQQTRMHMYEHETPPTNLMISILMLQYTFASSIPKPSNILFSKEKYLSF
jgi:hypothetical protein